jgi:hypothetical protein
VCCLWRSDTAHARVVDNGQALNLGGMGFSGGVKCQLPSVPCWHACTGVGTYWQCRPCHMFRNHSAHEERRHCMTCHFICHYMLQSMLLGVQHLHSLVGSCVHGLLTWSSEAGGGTQRELGRLPWHLHR